MKGLVLSGGAGTRLRPLTYTGAKQLVPLANKPVLFYVLEDLVSAGISDIGIVVGDTAQQIEEAVGDGSRFGCRITYIQQDRPGGLAHAVKTARPWLGDEPFVMYLGDNFIQGGIARFVEAFAASGAAAQLLLYPTDNPQAFGVAELRGGRIASLEEKPAVPRSNLALVGIYFFTAAIHDATNRITPSARGELEITDAIRTLIADGREVIPHVLDGWWIDTGKMEDMLDANRLVLKEMEGRIEGTVDGDCVVQGTVVVEAGATVRNSTLRGPLIIGSGACIENAYIGPFSAVGAECVVSNSELEYTILMERCRVVDLPHRLDASLIGRDVHIGRATSRPGGYKLMLGDHSVVGLT
jgi:glucose-1-phosphate thymidylyltransferase